MNTLKAGQLNKATVSQEIGSASYSGNSEHEITIFNPYGLITCAPADSRLILIPLNGNESNMYAIADMIERDSIPVPIEGEVLLANYLTGDYVHLKQQGINIVSKQDIKIRGKNITFEAYDKIIINSNTLEADQNEIKLKAKDSISQESKSIALEADVDIKGGFNATGSIGSQFTMRNYDMNGENVTLKIINGDVIVDGISLKEHEHEGGSLGGGKTGAPIKP